MPFLFRPSCKAGYPGVYQKRFIFVKRERSHVSVTIPQVPARGGQTLLVALPDASAAAISIGRQTDAAGGDEACDAAG
jgi:hypothetical protein